MKRPTRFFLIAHYSPGRGQSAEQPAYWMGPCSSYFIQEMRDVKRDRCYRSEAQACRMAAKLCNRYWWAKVVEVPAEALAD